MIIECRLTPFPVASVHGLVVEVPKGYILAINSNSCDIQRRRAFGHEMAHVVLNHINQSDRPIMDREREANNRAWEFYRRFRDEYNALVNGASSFEIKAE